MAWVYVLDGSVPVGATNPVSILDDTIQNDKKAWQERLNIDHMMALTGTQISDTDAGKHRKVTFYGVLSLKPTLEATECALYIKTVSGKSELFFENEDGTELQLTTGGKFNSSGTTIPDNTIDDGMIQLANNSYLKALNAAGLAEVDLIKANASDLPVLPDGAEMATSAAPTTDAGIANKAYADSTGACNASGVTVFNATLTAANTWQDLDLSAIVGARTALVQLQVAVSSDFGYMMKTKGYGETPPKFPSGYVGPNCAHFPGAGACSLQFTVMTNTSGVIQHCGTSSVITVTIKLIGWK